MSHDMNENYCAKSKHMQLAGNSDEQIARLDLVNRGAKSSKHAEAVNVHVSCVRLTTDQQTATHTATNTTTPCSNLMVACLLTHNPFSKLFHRQILQ